MLLGYPNTSSQLVFISEEIHIPSNGESTLDAHLLQFTELNTFLSQSLFPLYHYEAKIMTAKRHCQCY